LTAEPRLLYRIFGAISPYFRGRRLALFEEYLRPTPADSMLDVGGTTAMWEQAGVPVGALHVLNLEARWLMRDNPDAITPLVGDALNLPVADGAYDIVFSNSVIEHVGTWENQLRFADEVRRVGKRIWLQTPAREFFFEPHYLTPFIHFLPKGAQRRLLRWFSFSAWGWLTRPTPEGIAAMVDEIRLLSHAEMKALFPDCLIMKETFAGMTKSYIAFRA
jgi:SAM-dependent methyltransferase